MSTVLFKEFTLPEVDRHEVLRYMGCKESTAETEALIDRAIEIARGAFCGKVCFCELPLSVFDSQIQFGAIRTKSKNLLKNLDGCESVILFGATVGIEIDRLIMRYGKISPSLAVCLQALGAERIEALCDIFCADMARKQGFQGKRLRPRFSPGYGDFPLDAQKEIFAILGCDRRIGLTLNDSLIMSPTKSVTAIIGIY
ncbi:MAG: Vitamin B12 dependent methionine synthase activation subunit [Clostridia bacterium]|nr:Vitamin B12 dependent methionine synthase activation subunit [Clostridia bacterium]